MLSLLNKPVWNVYVAGALAGLLAVGSVLLSTVVLEKPKYLGTSTTFVRAAGLIERLAAPQAVENNEYYQSKKVGVDWQMMFVLGILMGALIASKLGKTFEIEQVPPIWKERFGPSAGFRALGGFIGGLIAIFGVRLAGGCPSGHGLSGMMQLAVSGLTAMAGFMAGGFLTAYGLYKRKGGQ